MERLIVFGCSLTYGHGLPDCFIPPKQPGSHPSKMGYPSILAKYMNLECINQSSPGASNKRIWDTVTKFNYHKNDIVIIQWSYIERNAIIHRDKIIDIGPWMPHSFYDTYDEYDSTIMSTLYVSHSNMFLSTKNIKVYNIIPGVNELPILDFNGVIIDHIPVYITAMRELYPLALDKRHPGIECQETYSKEILQYLNIKNDLPDHKPFGILGKFKRNIEFMRHNR